MSNYELYLGERIDVLIGEHRCISDVQAFSQDGELTLSAPTYKGMMVPLVIGELLHLVYYREGGMFSFMAELTERFQQKEADLVRLFIRSPISKYQRRDFVRIDLTIPISVRLVSSRENVEKRTLDETLRLIYDQRFSGIPRPSREGEVVDRCLTLDVSGGGVRFSGNERFEEGSIVETTFDLADSQHITVDAQVTRAAPDPSGMREYHTAVHFVNIEERLRRKIIKFIFDRQARAQKEMQSARA